PRGHRPALVARPARTRRGAPRQPLARLLTPDAAPGVALFPTADRGPLRARLLRRAARGFLHPLPRLVPGHAVRRARRTGASALDRRSGAQPYALLGRWRAPAVRAA